MKIEIGGGTIPREGFINLDPHHGEGDWRRIIQEGIPAADNSVEAVRASHVFEHIPAGQVRIDAFNEVHRVLQPGGTFEVVLPLLVGTWHAVADPTHVSYWVRESFLYFTDDPSWKANADYGMLLWKEVSWDCVDDWEGHWVGTPCK